jgi:hypothetical protein
MKHNRITTDEDNLGQPVFWQTPSYVYILINLQQKESKYLKEQRAEYDRKTE